MTLFQFSDSTCQVEGALVPVVELGLAAGDGVYFEHRVLMWKDAATPLGALPNAVGSRRTIAGRPYVITTAVGPGRIAFSRDSPGELVVLPLHPGVELDVREHAFLLASHTIQYSFWWVRGLSSIRHGGSGMYIDRFVAATAPGLLVLHGYGDVFERLLGEGERIMLEPGGFLYKDSTVQINSVQIKLKTGMLHRGMYLAEVVGPGRLGIQSMYRHHRTA
jgi:uncharacterized protein (AIM24 family)